MPFAPVTGGSSAGVLHAAGAQRGQLLASLLTNWLGQKQQDAERVKGEAKKAQALRKAISLYKPEMKDSVTSMGLPDLEGIVTGLGMQQKQADTARADGLLKLQQDQFNAGQQQKQADDVRADKFLQLHQDQFAAGQQQREAQGRMSELLARYAAAPASLGEQFATGTAGMDQPAGLTLDRYLAAAGEAKAQPDPRVLEQFIQNGQRQGREAAALQFQEDPVTGARMAVFGNSVLPTGINPAKQSAQAVDITDAEGNVIGRGLPGRNGFQLIRQPATEVDIKTRVSVLQAQLKNEFNPDRRKQLQAELDALMKGGAKAAAPAAAGTAVNDPLGLFN